MDYQFLSQDKDKNKKNDGQKIKDLNEQLNKEKEKNQK